jgi:DNA-binding MarR family transcriptional regulator
MISVMVGRLLDELHQTKPFQHRAEEAYLNIIRTADLLKRAVAEILKVHDLSLSQYNVLRILRGARQRPMSCGEVGSRLVTFEPDVTRLIDRLVQRDLAVRRRADGDKRQVLIHITADGLRLLKQLDAPIVSIHDALLGHLGDERLTQLINLTESIRDHTSTSETP